MRSVHAVLLTALPRARPRACNTDPGVRSAADDHTRVQACVQDAGLHGGELADLVSSALLSRYQSRAVAASRQAARAGSMARLAPHTSLSASSPLADQVPRLRAWNRAAGSCVHCRRPESVTSAELEPGAMRRLARLVRAAATATRTASALGFAETPPSAGLPGLGRFLSLSAAALASGATTCLESATSAPPTTTPHAAPAADNAPTPGSEHASAKWRVYTDVGRDLVAQAGHCVRSWTQLRGVATRRSLCLAPPFAQGKLDDAERYLRHALHEARAGFDAKDAHVAAALNNLAELYRSATSARAPRTVLQ